MEGKTSVRYLQEYIRSKDYEPEEKAHYFFKLAEEVGELSKAMRKDLRRASGGSIKGTIDEEIWDVIYYAVAIANCYGIDLEEAIKEKEKLNQVKYSSRVLFEEGR